MKVELTQRQALMIWSTLYKERQRIRENKETNYINKGTAIKDINNIFDLLLTAAGRK